SNPRPEPWQGSALPTALRPQNLISPPNGTDDQGGEIYPRFRELPKRIKAVNIGAILDGRYSHRGIGRSS
ncbi:MAG: hypothetical protein ACKOAJ_03115, partial [Actinomycetota bacterium]